MKVDRKLWVREAGEDIEALMELDQNHEAWKRLAHWYSQVLGGRGQAPLSREHLDSIATKRAELYRCRPPEELLVPIIVILAAVEYRIQGEEEVVRSLKRGRSGGPSGMRAEDLKELLRKASREMDPVTHQW